MTFKFLHCADLHLDSPLVGLSTRADAPTDRLRSATRRAMDNLVQYAIEEEVRFVVIAGDVYDGDWPDYTTGLFFNARMAELGRAGIRVFLVSGNHDADSQITRHLVLPDNVTRFAVDHPQTHVIDELAVAMHGQGFARREVRDNLVPAYPQPLPGYLNIGVLHAAVEGTGGHEAYAPCRLDDLTGKGYDYWALGHVHRRQVLSKAPWVVYPGNLQGRHIREQGPKGAMVVQVSGRDVLPRFVPLDVVRWHECRVNLTDAETDADFFERVAAAVVEYTESSTLPLVLRMLLEGTSALHGTLLADRERYDNEIRNAVMAVAGDDRVWIEKVLVGTTPLAREQRGLPAYDAMNLVAESLDRIEADEAFLADFLRYARAIQARMGAYARAEETTGLADLNDVRSLLPETREFLTTRLTKGRRVR